MRVLIVDDDETFCQFLAEVLEGQGMEAEWTTDGVGASEKSLHGAYDLFILDERMPLVSGSELAEDFREENPRAKIILVSAFADDELRTRLQRSGIPVLSKPFTASRLLEAIAEVLH